MEFYIILALSLEGVWQEHKDPRRGYVMEIHRPQVRVSDGNTQTPGEGVWQEHTVHGGGVWMEYIYPGYCQMLKNLISEVTGEE